MTLNLLLAFILEIALVIFLIFMAIYFTYSLIALVSFAPYVYSGKAKVLAMLDLAEVKAGMKILDIGSGNGELCVIAAERGAQAVGVEINPLLVRWSRIKAKRRGVADKLRFELADLWRFRYPNETQTVFVYGMPEKMDHLWRKMESELRPGTIVVSHAFKFPHAVAEKEEGNVRLYRL